MLAFILMLINSVLLVGFTFLMAAPLGLFIEASVSPIVGIVIGMAGNEVPHAVAEPFWYLIMVFAGSVTLLLIADLVFGVLFAFIHRSLTPLWEGPYAHLVQNIAQKFRLWRVRLYFDENDDSVNAYARSNFRYSSITITAGMVELLEEIRESQGDEQWTEVTRSLIGHECSHILHFDTVPQYLLYIGLDMGNWLFHFTVMIITLLGRAIMVVPVIGQLVGAYLILIVRWIAQMQVFLFHFTVWLQGVFYRMLSRRKEYRADLNGAQVSSPQATYYLLRQLAEISDCQRMPFLNTHPPIERRVLRQVRRFGKSLPKPRPRPLGKILMSLLAFLQIAGMVFIFLYAAESAGVIDAGAMRQIQQMEETVTLITGIDRNQVSRAMHPARIRHMPIVRQVADSWSAALQFQGALVSSVRSYTDQIFPQQPNMLLKFFRVVIPFLIVVVAQIFLVVMLFQCIATLLLRIEVWFHRSRINRTAESPLDFLIPIALRTGNFGLLGFAIRSGALFPALQESKSRMYRYVQRYR